MPDTCRCYNFSCTSVLALHHLTLCCPPATPAFPPSRLTLLFAAPLTLCWITCPHVAPTTIPAFPPSHLELHHLSIVLAPCLPSLAPCLTLLFSITSRSPALTLPPYHTKLLCLAPYLTLSPAPLTLCSIAYASLPHQPSLLLTLPDTCCETMLFER